MAVVVVQLSPEDRDTVAVVVAAKPLGAGTVLSAEDLRIEHYPNNLVPGGATADVDVELTGSGESAPSTGSSASAEDAETVDTWVGRTLSTAVVEGQPLTGPSVVGPDLLAEQPEGTTAVTIRVADPGALTHLRPGQRVDLVQRATGGGVLTTEPSEDPGAAGDEQGSSQRAEADGASESPAPASPSDGQEDSAADQTASDETDAGTSLVVARQVTVLWVADPAEPSTGLLSSTSGQGEQDLLVVGADAVVAQRIAASDAQQLVPVLVSSGESDADGSTPNVADAGT